MKSLLLFYLKYKLHVHSSDAYKLLKYMLPKKQVDVSSQIIAPMPGLVKSVSVQVGQLASLKKFLF